MISMTNILDKKYDILKASLSFPNPSDKDKLLEGFKDVVKELNIRKRDEALENISSLDYKTNTLEEEASRLKKILSCIRKYRDDFSLLNNEYKTITTFDLDDLFDDKEAIYFESRLQTINEYLSNINRINLLTKSLNKLNLKFNSLKEQENENIKLNLSLEESLLDYFISFIKTNSLYQNLEYEDLDFELDKLKEQSKIRFDELENFKIAYQSLENQNLPFEQKEEYKSYLQEARNNYFLALSKEWIYKLYKIIIIIEDDFSNLFHKRDIIKKIFDERSNIKCELEIFSNIDGLDDVGDFLSEQFKQIEKEKNVFDSIIELTKRIEDIEEEIELFKKKNESVEILTILDEFSMVDTYDYNDEDVDIIPNEIVKSVDCNNINLDKVHVESKKVMQEVINDIYPNDDNKEEEIFSVNSVDTIYNKDPEIKESSINDDIFISDENIFDNNSQSDDFFSMEEKVVLNNNLEDVAKENSFSDSQTSDFRLSSIGSVKPTSSYHDIESKVSLINDINVPTNGIFNDNNNDIFDSKEFLNKNEDV